MAAKYRKIDPRIWGDEKFSTLDPLAKLVAFHVITTSQSNRCGLFRFSAALGAEDTGLDPETFRERLSEVCQTLGWWYDQPTRVIYIPTWWKYNQPENPNVLKGCLDDLDDLPQNPLSQLFATNVEHLPGHCLETFREGMPKRLGKPPRNQEQEQEQEQGNTEGSNDPSASDRRDGRGDDPPVVSDPDPAEPAERPADAAERGQPARGQERHQLKPRDDAKPEHGELKAYWRRAWNARFGADYAFAHKADNAHLKWVLDHVGRDPAEAARIVDAYLADAEPWLADKGHTLGLLVSRFNRYTRKLTGDPGEVRGATRADVERAFAAAGAPSLLDLPVTDPRRTAVGL